MAITISIPAAWASRRAVQFRLLISVPAVGSSVPSISIATSFTGEAISYSLRESLSRWIHLKEEGMVWSGDCFSKEVKYGRIELIRPLERREMSHSLKFQ